MTQKDLFQTVTSSQQDTPCQPFSVAKAKSAEDDRHIWPEIRTIVEAKRPTWCVFENVYGHIKLGLDEVLSDLEAIGYATRPFVVPACAVNAPHKRNRVWIIAHADSERGIRTHHRCDQGTRGVGGQRRTRWIIFHSDRRRAQRRCRRGIGREESVQAI